MYSTAPLVVDTTPDGYSTEVDTRTDIQVTWNTDLNRDHLKDSLFLSDDKGQNVEIQISYSNRTLILQPVGELMANTRYTLRIVGGTDGQNNPVGIRDILNNPLAKDFVLAFNTVTTAILDAPYLVYPVNQTIIQQQPVFKWEPVDGAVSYQIKVSTTTSLVPVVWPSDSDIVDFATTEISPGYQFPDGTYYWAVRGVTASGAYGEWSTVYSFSKDTVSQGTQASGDTVPTDAVPYYEEQAVIVPEILEIFPEMDQSNVDIRIKHIYVLLNGHYTSEEIRAEHIQFTGMNVDGMIGNPDFEDHGDVSFKVEVLPQNDGTTLLKLTPDTVTFVNYMSTQF